MLKAIIFDLDGVISDTDRTRFDYLKEKLKEKNIILNDSEYKNSVGKRTVLFLKELFGDRLNEMEIEKIYQNRKKDFHKNPEKYIVEQPFAKICCKRMYETGLTLAIASASMSKEIKAVLKNLGLSEYFKVIVGSDKINNPKPHPETYLKCAEELGFQPKECVAIEDSPRGVEAAKSAGCYCIAVTYTHENKELDKADLVVDSLDEISKELIKRLPEIFFG